jgi:hypothetical protein
VYDPVFDAEDIAVLDALKCRVISEHQAKEVRSSCLVARLLLQCIAATDAQRIRLMQTRRLVGTPCITCRIANSFCTTECSMHSHAFVLCIAWRCSEIRLLSMRSGRTYGLQTSAGEERFSSCSR